jgi:transposase
MAPNYDAATRAQVVTLKAWGFTNNEITSKTGIPSRTIRSIYATAIKRGFDPNTDLPIVKNEHVVEAPRSGRPTKQIEENEQEIVAKIRRDRYGREKTCAQITAEMGNISVMTVWRILRTAGFKKTKPTRKPGLSEAMKKARLEFALRYQHWTLEDWKSVIWSDETSVVLNHRRGGYRLWRKSEERLVKSCIRERWKGYSEFMFWGCFSYDKKGPCHIWKSETAK